MSAKTIISIWIIQNVVITNNLQTIEEDDGAFKAYY
jgi:hypothetical protein